MKLDCTETRIYIYICIVRLLRKLYIKHETAREMQILYNYKQRLSLIEMISMRGRNVIFSNNKYNNAQLHVTNVCNENYNSYWLCVNDTQWCSKLDLINFIMQYFLKTSIYIINIMRYKSLKPFQISRINISLV